MSTEACDKIIDTLNSEVQGILREKRLAEYRKIVGAMGNAAMRTELPVALKPSADHPVCWLEVTPAGQWFLHTTSHEPRRVDVPYTLDRLGRDDEGDSARVIKLLEDALAEKVFPRVQKERAAARS